MQQKYSEDSFSSGDDESHLQPRRGSYRQRKRKPIRSITHKYGLSIDQKAKEGIFVVDPFHFRVNLEFLKAFSRHYHTLPPSFLNIQDAYFSSSSEEDEAEIEKELNVSAPDMSHLGFNTNSSASSNEEDWVDSSPTAKKPKRAKTTSTTHNNKSNKNNHHHHRSVTNSSDSRIVASSSLPRSTDNSSQFTESLSVEDVQRLFQKVSSNYKNYPLAHRHGSTPMDITEAPGVQLLTEDEFVTCCLLRIRPALYYHARSTLLHNYHHAIGYFKKSAAQKMLRIDVNKTGKLYEFLVRQNWIPAMEGGQCQPEPAQIVIDDPETYHQL